MTIRVSCPNPDCGAVASVEEQSLGRKGRCKKCGHVFALARPGGEAASAISGDASAWKRAQAASPLTIPEQFGRYRIKKQLGQGGMGAVYLAHDIKLDRQVALKVPFFHPAEGESAIQRFEREARAAATLDHPNLCPVFDVGEIEGIHYLTMPYIEGKPLSEAMNRDQTVTETQAAALIRKLALALHEAHEKGIIHRDLKPGNIMVNRRRELVIMDFGLARMIDGDHNPLTKSGHALGTALYMAPEQAAGDINAVGPASDVYSLGVMLFELLTGLRPFEGPWSLVIGLKTIKDPDPPSTHRSDLSHTLNAICLKAIAKDPKDRYRTMAELAEALNAFLTSVHSPSPILTPSGTSYPAKSPESLAAEVFAGLITQEAISLREEKTPIQPKPCRTKDETSTRTRRGWIIGGSVATAVLLIGFIVYMMPRKDNEPLTVLTVTKGPGNGDEILPEAKSPSDNHANSSDGTDGSPLIADDKALSNKTPEVIPPSQADKSPVAPGANTGLSVEPNPGKSAMEVVNIPPAVVPEPPARTAEVKPASSPGKAKRVNRRDASSLIFDGARLNGFVISPQSQGMVDIADRALILQGSGVSGSGPVLLVSTRSDFKNFYMRATWLSPNGMAGHINFHRSQMPANPWSGYGVLVGGSPRNESRQIPVGSIYKNTSDQPTAPLDWKKLANVSPQALDQLHTVEIIVVNNQFTTKIDGKDAAVFVDQDNPIRGGQIALICGATSGIFYKSIEIVELDDKGVPLVSGFEDRGTPQGGGSIPKKNNPTQMAKPLQAASVWSGTRSGADEPNQRVTLYIQNINGENFIGAIELGDAKYAVMGTITGSRIAFETDLVAQMKQFYYGEFKDSKILFKYYGTGLQGGPREGDGTLTPKK